MKLNFFLSDYLKNLIDAISGTDVKNIEKAILIIKNTIKNKGTIYVCGNGGSAAIANHYVCDYLKFLRQYTKYRPKIISLSNSIETITAIANDINYKKIFSYQAEVLCEKRDLILLISSSGNSKNIIELLNFAKRKKIKTIGFSGFGGGSLKKKSNLSIHINVNNYGIVEDSHHILMHVIIQYLIEEIKFKK